MRRREMSASETFRYLLPKKRSHWRVLAGIFIILVLAIATVPAIFYMKHLGNIYREKNWVSSVATIEDGRTRLAMLNNSQFGTAMLYNVEVLAKYSVGNSEREQWIALSQTPKSMGEAKLQMYLLKGKHCIVRWKPSDQRVIVAEIN